MHCKITSPRTQTKIWIWQRARAWSGARRDLVRVLRQRSRSGSWLRHRSEQTRSSLSTQTKIQISKLARAWIRARQDPVQVLRQKSRSGLSTQTWISIWKLAWVWIRADPEPVGALEGGSGAPRGGFGWIEWNPDPLSGSGLNIISRYRVIVLRVIYEPKQFALIIDSQRLLAN